MQLKRHTMPLTDDQIASIISEWEQSNPERNAYQYDNFQLVQIWRKQAAIRLREATSLKDTASILDTLSTELEASNT